MYNIDPNLYATNAFYRELVDQTRISEKKQLQLRMEQDRLKAERDIFYRQLPDVVTTLTFFSFEPDEQNLPRF